MRQLTHIAFLSTLTLVMGGCGPSGGGGDQTTASSPSPTATSTNTQSPTPQAFETPLVEQQRKPTPAPGNEQPKVVAVTPPELIAPTDPNQRRTQLQKEKQQGATDPFGVLPIPPTPPELDANSPTPSAPASQSVERAVPQLPQLPLAQPPTLRVSATSQEQRGVPQLPGLSIPQTPTLRVGTANGNRGVFSRPVIITTPQRFLTPGRTIPSRTRVQPQQRPRFGLGQAPQPSRQISPQIRIAQRPQRTQQVASRAIIAQPSSSTSRTVARTPQRSQTPNRTVARTPQRSQTPNRTVASQRRTVNPATVAQARPQTINQPTTIPTPNAIPTTPAIIAPPAPPVIPTLPPPPDPILAKAVEVSGVVIVGNEPQAILKAPNEATSRYVKVGQRLSNGQVLVKRIEVYEGSEPMVILEQNGIEVSKGVGERPAAPAQPNSQPATPQATV